MTPSPSNLTPAAPAATLLLTGDDLPAGLVASVLQLCPAWGQFGPLAEPTMRGFLIEFDYCLVDKLDLLRKTDLTPAALESFQAAIAYVRRTSEALLAVPDELEPLLQMRARAWWQAFALERMLAGDDAAAGSVLACRKAAAELRGGAWLAEFLAMATGGLSGRWQAPFANPVRVVFGPWLDPQADPQSRDLDRWAQAADWQRQADHRRSLDEYAQSARSRRKLCAALAVLAQADDRQAQHAWLEQQLELAVDLRLARDDAGALAAFDLLLPLLDPPGAAPSTEALLLRARTFSQRGFTLDAADRAAEAVESWALALADYERLLARQDLASHRAEQAYIESRHAGVLADLGRHQQALAGHERAIAAFQRLTDHDGRSDLLALLLSARGDRAEALRRLGQPMGAADELERVLAAIERLTDGERRSLMREESARLRGMRADALDDSGRIDEALRDYAGSIAEYDALLAYATAGPYALHFQRASALSARNDYAGLTQHIAGATPSVADLRLAGGLPPAERLRAARARLGRERAIALMSWGRLGEALLDLDGAIAAYQRLSDDGAKGPHRPMLASTHLTRGHALQDLGRLDEAIAEFDRAIEIHQRLIEQEGLFQYRAWQASACVSRAIALNLHGRTDASIAAHEQALATYTCLIETEGQPGLLPVLAWAHGCHGLALRRAPRLLQALAAFDQALSMYDRLIDIDGQQQLGSRRAWACSERAKVLIELDRPEEAAEAAAKACAEFDRLVDGRGYGQLRWQRAWARLIGGTALSRLGRLHEAAACLEAAVADYLQLMEGEGQWEYLAAGVEAVAAAWSAACAQHDEDRMAAHTGCLQRWLVQAPLDRGHHQLAAVLAWLPRAMRAWRELAAPGASALGPAHWQAHWQSLLAWASDLLREPDARWLGRAHVKTRLHTMLQQLFELAEAQGSPALTQWFLQTQSLRAQRGALMPQTGDEALRAWRELWLEHDALVTELLHPRIGDEGPAAPAGAPGGDGIGPGRSQEAEGRAQAHLACRRLALDARRRECRGQLEVLRTGLERNGTLPAEQALNLTHLATLLPPGQGLLLLTPLPRGGGWLAQLVARPAATADGLAAGAELQHRTWTLNDRSVAGAAAGLDHLLAGVDACLAQQQGQRSLRDGTVAAGPAGGEALATLDPAATLAAAHGLHRAMAQALRPALEQLSAWDCSAVALVPTGVLHGVPWLRALNTMPEARRLRLRLYPSVAAWWQARSSQPLQAQLPMLPAALPRVATLVHDALMSQAPLPWVHMELALLRELWGAASSDAWVELSRDRPRWPPAMAEGQTPAAAVDCLIAVGHSTDRDGTGVRCGLLLGKTADGADRVFTGHELAGIRRARRLLLSCCTLGRVGDTLGEAHGLLSTAFAFDTAFASGSLLRVGDVEAALFSAAFHWALKAAYEQSLPAIEPSWAVVFLAVQDTVAAGGWPAGFGPWLAGRLPELAQGLWLHKPAACVNTQRTWREIWGAQLSRQTGRYVDLAVADPWQGSMPQRAALQTLAQAWAQAPPGSLQELAHWLVCMGE